MSGGWRVKSERDRKWPDFSIGVKKGQKRARFAQNFQKGPEGQIEIFGARWGSERANFSKSGPKGPDLATLDRSCCLREFESRFAGLFNTRVAKNISKSGQILKKIFPKVAKYLFLL